MRHLRLIEGGSAEGRCAPVRRPAPPLDERSIAAAARFLQVAAAAIGSRYHGPGGAATGAMLALFVAEDTETEIDTPAEMEAFREHPLHPDVAAALGRLATARRTDAPLDGIATAGAVAGLLCAGGPVALSRVLPDVALAAAALASALAAPAHADVPRAVLPAILHRAAATLATKALAGREVTSATVTRVTIRQAAAVLGCADALAEAVAIVETI